jgi:hypothetical protein
MDWKPHIARIIARLGEDVTFTHGIGSPVTVRGLFLNPFQDITLGGTIIAGSTPRLVAMTADLPSVAIDDTIGRASAIYKIKNTDDDDPGGFTIFKLELQ